MWPYQHLDENVVSPPQNATEEVADMSTFSSSPPLSPLVDFHERDTPPPPPQSTQTPRRFTICGVETTDEIESQCALRRNPFNRGINVRIPLSSRSRSPLLVRPAVWRRGTPLPLRGTRRPTFRRYNWLEDTMTDSDDEDLEPPISLTSSSDCTSVDLLLLKSLDSYRSECLKFVGQQSYRTRHVQVLCEVLSMHTSEELAAAVRRPPINEVLWPRRHLIRPNPLSYGHDSSASDNEDESQIDSDEDDDTSSEEIETEPLRITTSGSSSIRSSFMFDYKTSLHEVNSQPPEMSRPRRRLCAIQSMPKPSLLAKQVANRVIKHARYARNLHEEDMCCLTCGLFPICPVTGQCGHTRCSKCIGIMTSCPCGNESPESLSVNILIRDLLVKTAGDRTTRYRKGVSSVTKKRAVPANKLLTGARGSSAGPIRPKRSTRHFFAPTGPYQQHNPMSARARFAYALELLQSGRHRDAAPQFALAAASCDSDLRLARTLLAQVIMVLSEDRDPRTLTRELNHFVTQLTSISWIKSADMECILCCDVFTAPVTTPCGHMFCRTCLEKTLDYRKRCPLCLRGLGDFKLTETKDTSFVKGALASVNALHIPKPMEEDDLVPIFVCTVAYPSVPCPLFIFDPRYWLMIRRVLESGSRRFGMVAMDRDRKYADFGTVLEVRDCVHLEDGRSILSTIGLTRFKVIERCVRDGCEVARIQPIHDIRPAQGVATADLKIYASQIMLKAIFWLSQLSAAVLSDIENAFGSLPTSRDENDSDDWWETSDGPSWLWWLVAVLPLRTEIKVLILSTNCLIKRMMAIARTLEAVARVSLTVSSPGQCLRRNVPPTSTSSSVVN